MIDYETYCKIKHYHQERQLNETQIAQALALDSRTVAKGLDAKRYHPRASAPRVSQLDPYKSLIRQWLEAHPYSITQVFQRLKEAGYPGGYTLVKNYVNQVRPTHAPAFLTLSFEPGEAAQVDWGVYGSVNVGNTRRRLSFFVMVLCYSRLMYLEFTVSQTLEHFLGCHQNAFQAFGVVPRKIMVDNLKSAILKRITGQDPQFNPRYQDFANHYGFNIAPCGVRRGNEKGRVEKGVKWT